jgi:S-adenosyl-L-methionine hydrolase (adenosine-forming)
MRCLSLLTDFGLDDAFVAACHGVIATIAPAVRVIDVTHLVPPGDIRRGSVLLAQALPYLPDGVHVGIVDPGVGTTRRPIAISAGGSVLVGPDNGLLLPAAEALGGIEAVHEITNTNVWRNPVSATFHGRDIFSPTAAHLITDTALSDVGPLVDVRSLVRLPEPRVEIDGAFVRAEILSIDRFGNVQLAVAAPPWHIGQQLTVRVSGAPPAHATFERTFGAVRLGSLVIYVDSSGLVALALNGASARDMLQVRPGTVVEIAPE